MKQREHKGGVSPATGGLLFLILALPVLAGCAGLGHGRIEGERNNYNVAIQRSNDEQLLLNLARLRYRDTPFFLEVSSVATQFSYRANAGADSKLQDGVKGLFTLGAGAAIEERPTVTYAPLQGEAFIKRFLAQIPLETVVLLARTGWSFERVLRVCLQKLGPLNNAPNASGPTPATAPDFERFVQAAKWLRSIRVRQGLEVSLGTDGSIRGLVVRFKPTGLQMAETRQLLDLLGRPRGTERLFFTSQAFPADKPYLRMETRSLIGVMYYLSHGVQTSRADQEKGRVTVTLNAAGQPFDWNQVTGELMQVHSSPVRPDNAMVAVNYRGWWFYLDDGDLNSKSTFSLLSQLFYLQAGDAKVVAPTLTLPVGN